MRGRRSAARPAPQTPVFASTTTSAIEPGARERREREQRRGREAAGVGDEAGAARSPRGAARSARRPPRPAAPAPRAATYHSSYTPRSRSRKSALRSTTRTPRSRSCGDDRRGGAVRVGDDRRVDVAVAVEVELLERRASRGGAGTASSSARPASERDVTGPSAKCGWRSTSRAAIAPAKPEAPATSTRGSATQLTPDLALQRGDDLLAQRRDVLVGQRAVARRGTRGAARATRGPRRPARRGRRRTRCASAISGAAGVAHDVEHAGRRCTSSATIDREVLPQLREASSCRA